MAAQAVADTAPHIMEAAEAAGPGLWAAAVGLMVAETVETGCLAAFQVHQHIMPVEVVVAAAICLTVPAG
jgi:hypothetical protein